VATSFDYAYNHVVLWAGGLLYPRSAMYRAPTYVKAHFTLTSAVIKWKCLYPYIKNFHNNTLTSTKGTCCRVCCWFISINNGTATIQTRRLFSVPAIDIQKNPSHNRANQNQLRKKYLYHAPTIYCNITALKIILFSKGMAFQSHFQNLYSIYALRLDLTDKW
jgi:hypothetical protein